MQRSASSVASSQKLSQSPSTASLNAVKKNGPTAQGSFEDLMIGYFKSTTPSIRALDGFLTFCFITGVLQAVYCLLVSSFPYNAFIGVFASSVGSFVFAGKLQSNRESLLITL